MIRYYVIADAGASGITTSFDAASFTIPYFSPVLRRARFALHLKAAYTFPSSSSLPKTIIYLLKT